NVRSSNFVRELSADPSSLQRHLHDLVEPKAVEGVPQSLGEAVVPALAVLVPPDHPGLPVEPTVIRGGIRVSNRWRESLRPNKGQQGILPLAGVLVKIGTGRRLRLAAERVHPCPFPAVEVPAEGMSTVPVHEHLHRLSRPPLVLDI